MILKKAAVLFGIVFLLVGLLGFVPAVAPNGMLLGIFHVNAAHNVVHLLSGAVALGCGFASVAASQMFFRIFGVVYGLVAILGFVQGNALLLGMISNNMADTWLHVAISAAALVLSFAVREPVATARI